MCRHDFQPTILDYRTDEARALRLYCLKCDTVMDIEEHALASLKPISERIRTPRPLN